ncbi:MAG: TldD/PmbA family protein [Firmicutes bacterium]|nr:TldD/PmbA family protein [Bacillota bacterium]
MRNLVEDALKATGADYAEIRIEERQTTRIAFRGRTLEEIGTSVTLGGSARALVRGGWGFVSFDGVDGLKERVGLAVSQARLATAGDGHVSRLSPVEPVIDSVKAGLIKDPRYIPLSVKKRLLEEYNEIILGSGPRIQTSSILYVETFTRKYFANTEGTYVDQESSDIGMNITAIARDGDNVQQCFLPAGGTTGFQTVEGHHEKVKDIASRAVEMLDADPVKAGEYTVVIDPGLTGVFIHEAFGHLSESDFVYENERLQEIMTMGARFGPDILNVVDGAAVEGHRGSYRYDDEGVPSRMTHLIRNGILVGRLHSRETAAKMGELPTGNARAINYRHRPIVRMTNTFIENGTTSFEDMISDIEEGVYAIEAYGGETAMEMFTFSAGEAFMIRNGKIAERVRDVVLTGNLFDTLKNIECIGNDFEWHDGGAGGCGKGGQFPLPVGDGGPHVRIRKVVIGGR